MKNAIKTDLGHLTDESPSADLFKALQMERAARVAAELRAKQAEDDARTDKLTGLPNRRSFEEALKDDYRRARRAGAPHSVLVIDIDHFKRVNDTYGHDGGDKVLRHIARVLERHKREEDTTARYGGEEFAVSLYNCSLENATIIADEIRRDIEQSPADIGPDRATCTVTASVGVATLHSTDFSGSSVFSRADEALYYAKHDGRNIVAFTEAPGVFQTVDRDAALRREQRESVLPDVPKPGSSASSALKAAVS